MFKSDGRPIIIIIIIPIPQKSVPFPCEGHLHSHSHGNPMGPIGPMGIPMSCSRLPDSYPRECVTRLSSTGTRWHSSLEHRVSSRVSSFSNFYSMIFYV